MCSSLANATNRDITKILSEARSLLLLGKRIDAVKLLREHENEGNTKSILIAEQFVTGESFQKYQDMKAYADAELWTDCIKINSQIGLEDSDNTLVLKTLAQCQVNQGLKSEAKITYQKILQLCITDSAAIMGLAKLNMHNKEYDQALKLLEPLLKRKNINQEKLSLLRSEIHYFAGHLNEAISILQQDQEANLNHMEVLYKLGEYLQEKKNEDWQSRRAFALFISRYKRLNKTNKEKLRLEPLFIDAQARLVALDKKLEVSNTDLTVKTNNKSSSITR